MSVRYTAYKLTASDGSTLVETDFQSELSVKQSVIRQVLADLQSFSIGGKTDNKSQLSVSVDDQNFSVTRDYKEHILTIEPQTDIAKTLAEWRNNFIVVPPELNPQLQDQLVATVKKFAQQSGGGSTDNIKQQIKAEGELGTKHLEIIEKINVLETDLGKQKSMDESTLSLSELEAAQTAIEDQIASVHNLLEKQAQINQTLAKYGEVAQQDLEAESIKNKEQLQQLRQQELVTYASEHGFDPVAASKVTDFQIKRQGWHASYLAVFGALILAAGIAGFAITGNSLLILIAGIISLMEFGVFGAINYIPSQIDIRRMLNEDPDLVNSLTAPETTSPNSGIIAKLEKFFIDKAWVAALKNEAKYMNETISTKLDGKNVTDLQTSQQNLKQSISDLKIEIEKYKDQEIPPQQYLQKRRELDMLNIDKARSERDLRNAPNGNKILDLVDSMSAESSESVASLDPQLGAALGITNVTLDGSEVNFQYPDGSKKSATEIDKNVIYTIVLWYRLLDWQGVPQMPFVMADTLTGEENSYKLLMDKLSELRTIGQLVRIKLLP